MVFSSLLFMFIYLVVVLAVYYISPIKLRNLWLFIVNLIFYAWGEPVYVLLMVFSICINYVSGFLVDKYRENNHKKAKRILIINIVINLAMLGFFKYYDLFASTLSMIPGVNIKTLGLTLPIGISFYTFQTMSYPIDIYRGNAKLQRNFISFGTFVALFPQLIAGPIVRYKDIADQLGFRANSIDQFASGVRRFCVGLAKKVLIANNIGMLWDVYNSMAASEMTVLGAWMGIAAFSLQLYFDFSAYSDMAIGLGRMLGFEFLENFNYPYISKSVTEFWRRWHMSLGTWFRDYLYIPLGGNRCSKGRQFFNILIVWAATGFWHGANWTFLCWGLYYALFLMIEKSFLLKKLNKAPVIGHVYTLLVAVCGWVLFDLPSLSAAGSYYASMFGFAQGGFANAADIFYLKNYALIFIAAIIASMPIGAKIYRSLPCRVQNVLTPVLIVCVLVLSTAYLVDASYNPFLYFRF